MTNINNFIKHSLNNELRAEWEKLLKHFTLEDINREFETYKTNCLKYSTTFNLIENNIEKMFNTGESIFPNFKYSITSQEGEYNNPLYFFRIRKIKNLDFNKINTIENINIEEIQTLSDVWEKPSKLVNHYQRLSKPKQSVLYTSLMPSTAILETKLKKDDFFALIIYKSKRRITYSDCSNFIYFENLTENENMKRYLIFNLLRNEFTRIFPKKYYSENQYCIANAISRKFFISDKTDGIQYPSVRGFGHSNFAFFSNSIKNNLELVGLRCCKLVQRKNTETKLEVMADCFWDELSEKFKYYSPYSEKSKKIFEEKILSGHLSK